MKPSEKLAEAYRLTERAATLAHEAWMEMTQVPAGQLSAGQFFARQATSDAVFRVMQALGKTKLEAGIIYAVVEDLFEAKP